MPTSTPSREAVLLSSATEPVPSRREERLFETIATLILALATIGTAWSGYQATRWSGEQAADYVLASTLRVDATRAATRAGQDRLFDSQVFSQWLNASATGDQDLATRYERRFREEFRPAFQAWLATDPFNDPTAPPGPLYMPEYVSAAQATADRLDLEADARFAEGQEANEVSDQYVLDTVFLASALFLAGIAGRFTWRVARYTVLATSAIALSVGIVNLVSWPVM